MSHRDGGQGDSNEIPGWLRHSLMAGIFLVWCVFMVAALVGHTKVEDIPLPLWSVPGVTYGLLYGKLPKFGSKNGGDPR